MATQEEVAQRRREKILARATEEDKGDEVPTGQSAFDRYKDIKQREKAQNTLIEVSKGIGLLIALLALLLPPQAVFSAVLTIMIGTALRLSSKTTTDEPTSKDQFAAFGPLAPYLDKFQHIERVLLVLKVAGYVLLSYLLAAVLVSLVVSSSTRLSTEL